MCNASLTLDPLRRTMNDGYQTCPSKLELDRKRCRGLYQGQGAEGRMLSWDKVVNEKPILQYDLVLDLGT